MRKALVVSASVGLVASLACGRARGLGEPTALSVSSVNPMSASAFTGDRVVVNGAGFGVGTTVMFGDTAGYVTAVHPNQLVVTTASRAAGTVQLIVTNRGGDQVRVAGFEFLDFQLTRMVPAAGLPPQFVTLDGAGFRAGARVSFGGVPATIHSITSRTIRLTAPVLPSGVHDVELINGDGRSATRPAEFEYLPVTIALSQSTVAPGSLIRVSWSCPFPRRFDDDFFPTRDLLVMSRAGDGDVVWQRAHTVVAQSGTVDMTAPQVPGDYEFRYFLDERYRYATVSFTVGGDR